MSLYSTRLYTEGKKACEIRLLALFLNFLKGVRKLSLIYFFSLVICILITAGVFIITVQLLNQIYYLGFISFDVVIGVGFFLCLLGLFFVTWGLSEKRWIVALGLHDQIEKFTSPQVLDSKEQDKYLSIDKSELNQIISDFIDEKMKTTHK